MQRAQQVVIAAETGSGVRSANVLMKPGDRCVDGSEPFISGVVEEQQGPSVGSITCSTDEHQKQFNAVWRRTWSKHVELKHGNESSLSTTVGGWAVRHCGCRWPNDAPTCLDLASCMAGMHRRVGPRPLMASAKCAGQAGAFIDTTGK